MMAKTISPCTFNKKSFIKQNEGEEIVVRKKREEDCIKTR